jgi:HEPN domain-containing protein
MAKPTQAELDDEADRTRPVAYFNFAETYWTAAKALRKSKAKSTHKESPIRFLYYHAIELYLKAYLRAFGVHPYDMREKLRHNVGKLSTKAAEFGLTFDDEDLEIFELMANTDAVIRSRYILTGPYTWPDIGALNRVCIRLRRSVGSELKAKGEPVRLSRC